MPVIEFNQKDLNWGRIVEPAWYRVRIDNVGEEPAKDSGKGPSTNYPVDAEILFNGDNGGIEYTGVGLRWNFNSKAMGGAIGFLKGFGIEPKVGVRVELKAAEGKTIDVYVENDTWQGRVLNRVNHKYRAPKEEVRAVTA